MCPTSSAYVEYKEIHCFSRLGKLFQKMLKYTAHTAMSLTRSKFQKADQCDKPLHLFEK